MDRIENAPGVIDKYKAEQFGDLKIVRYDVPGFEKLSAKQKELLYYLSQAALSGRDIMYDQNGKDNLAIRRANEAIINHYNGERKGEEWDNFMMYAKQVWFANGIHHHYSNDKFIPRFSNEYYAQLLMDIDKSVLPMAKGETVEEFTDKIITVMFDENLYPKKVYQGEGDKVTQSSVNFYEGVTEEEVKNYYASKEPKTNKKPEIGLNSKIIKNGEELQEQVYMVGGMYDKALREVVSWLEKAMQVAENEQQAKVIENLIKYYRSGDVSQWDTYNISWVNDTESRTDFINGFIEVYNDPLGRKGSFESVVSFKDMEATKRIDAIAKEAQWFEDNSSIMDEHKKKDVVGITAKVITVVMESGDASPSTPIGINLPNNNWIRQEHGSKSVNLGNIVGGYEKAAKEGNSLLAEFAYSKEEIERSRKYGSLASNLHTDMHEVIGHASGIINDGVGTPKETLKEYASTLEEGRADLVALYFMMDKKLVDIGVMPNLEVGKVAYDDYIRNGLMTQLTRIKPGDKIEEAHMRNRQLIAKWAYKKGGKDNVIEMKKKDGKTFFVINDYEKLRGYFGELLKELQRIKSEGDYEAGKNLVETYAVDVEADIHEEVLQRFEKLDIAPYGGFINPHLTPVMEKGKIVDVIVSYPDDFTQQMLYYAKTYSFLPTYN